jgi:hypothetical protein
MRPPHLHWVHAARVVIRAETQHSRAIAERLPDAVYAYNNFVKELQSPLQSSYQVARNNLVRHKERSKEYRDRNVNTPLLTIDDKVLLHDERIRKGRSANLSSRWIGPYDIVDIDDVNVTLKLPRNKTLKVHANRLKPFF